MCGIFGAVKLNGYFNGDDFNKFVHLTNKVEYRGPDSAGYLGIDFTTKSIDNSQFNLFLGHRRLSIIDLSEDGNQPMRLGDNLIVYNGEIFNYIELRDELKKAGAIFSTETDTEVILQLYNLYGENAFDRLNGMWAIILLDLKKKKLVVSRDRFSIKPLFYYKTKDAIYFGSELIQLLNFLPSVQPNEDALYAFIQQNLVDINESTFFKDLYRIPAKTNYVIDLQNGKESFGKYWDYSFEEISDEKYAFERFQELFYDSVRIRLRSDVEVGSLLSGGLDSSSITIAAQKYCTNDIKAFSVISGDSKISEEKFIDILIKENKVNCFKLNVLPQEIFANLNKTIEAQGEPFPTFSIVAQYSILEKIKKETNIKVVLSGQGGDELLMGYLKYYFFYLNHLLKSKKFLIFAGELFGSLVNRTAITQLRLDVAKRYIPHFNKNNVDYLSYKGNIEKIWEVNSISDRQKKDVDFYSVPMLARFEDRNSMAHSLETRLPMLDHRLVNFVLNVDPALKIKNGWTKYLLRKSVKDLPNKIKWRRDKLGFAIPEKNWLKNDFRKEITGMFDNSVLGKIGIINPKRFLKYYHRFLNDDVRIHYSDISKILVAEKWARKFFDGDTK